jgi:hypothetical protein
LRLIAPEILAWHVRKRENDDRGRDGNGGVVIFQEIKMASSDTKEARNENTPPQ